MIKKQLKHKQQLRQKRIWRIRKKVAGTAERPRLCVTFTNAHIHAQVIDDEAGRTLHALSTQSKALREEKLSANRASAVKLGEQLGGLLAGAGIKEVVFDRHGRPYHGRVKEFAEAVRGAGVQF